MDGYNFTDRTRRALHAAGDEAAALQHEYIGTEHILLGLLRDSDSVALAVLTNLHSDIAGIRAEIKAVVKPGRSSSQSQRLLRSHAASEYLVPWSLYEASRGTADRSGRHRGGLRCLGRSRSIDSAEEDSDCHASAKRPRGSCHARKDSGGISVPWVASGVVDDFRYDLANWSSVQSRGRRGGCDSPGNRNRGSTASGP